MNIAILGMGGVGGFFGGKLAHLIHTDKNLSVYFIARGSHLDAIKKNGLEVVTPEGSHTYLPTLATDNPCDLPQLDYLMVCVKSYDLEKALESIKDKVTKNTIIHPLLNGVTIFDRVKTIYPHSPVLPSCVYIGTHIEKPGTVMQNGGACIIHMGEDPSFPGKADIIKDLFDRAKIQYNYSDKVQVEIWSKFIFIAAFALVTARYNATFGEVLSSASMERDLRAIMEEIKTIAYAKHINLPESIVDDTIEKARKFPADAKTSFQRDFERSDKPDERDIFGTAILNMASTLDIQVETTKALSMEIQKIKPLT